MFGTLASEGHLSNTQQSLRHLASTASYAVDRGDCTETDTTDHP